MRTNLPVSDVERPFPTGATIVSNTDLKGNVTYVNDVFIEISGFSRDEMLGNSHNLVRHPDMPTEAFADLWATIKSGLPWRGMVKNRCKNGDYYWVKALVVPVRENNQTIGYMSVRTRPTDAEKRAAAELYRAVREGRARLKKRRLADLIFRFGFNTRFALFVALMVLLTAAAGVAGLSGSKDLTVGIWILSLVTALGSMLFMSATIARPLQEASGYFDQISQGNLLSEIPVHRPDEVGRVLAGLAIAQTHMRVMIDQIRLGAQAVEERSEHLEREVAHVTEVSSDQAGRISQVSNAMDELSSSVAVVAQTDATAADSARSTQDVVDEGNSRMQKNIAAADQVAQAVQASGKHIGELNVSIGQIGAMAGAIKEIADQTNLLALNAAIEAARAGEQGRGFAVVADEVRKLAERTATTTGEINRMVESVQTTTRATVTAMDRAVTLVREGRELTEQTHQSFQEITRSSRHVTEISESIADAAKEQSAATGEVAANTEQMAQLVERNNASIVELRDAVSELKQTADGLRDMVAHFRADR